MEYFWIQAWSRFLIFPCTPLNFESLKGHLPMIYDPTVNSLFPKVVTTSSTLEVEVGVSGNCSKPICKRAFGIRIAADKKKKRKKTLDSSDVYRRPAYTTKYIHACRYITRQEFALPPSSSPFPNIGNLYSIVETSETWHLHPQGVPSIITAPTPYFCIS